MEIDFPNGIIDNLNSRESLVGRTFRFDNNTTDKKGL
jgi:hypothetical protein